MMRALSVMRPDPGSPDGMSPDDSRARLATDDAIRVADYLDAGAVIARTTARMADPWSAGTQIPLTQRTDGVWRWDDTVSYYVRRYHLSPGADFVAYLRDRGFAPRNPAAVEVSAAAAEVFGPTGDSAANRVLLLDGSQLLPRDTYGLYRGQLYRCRTVGRRDAVQIELSVSPGQAVPEGFTAESARDAFIQSIAYATVAAAEVDAFYRVITSCRYKGSRFSIMRIDGTRLRVSIGGGRRLDPSVPEPPSPTRDVWNQFPNVEVLGIGDIWADIDILEAARVIMAVIPCQLVSGRLMPVCDPTGAGYPVPAPDHIHYFPAPADSPYLPPADALATVRAHAAAHDPGYSAGDLTPVRLRDGWRLQPGRSVASIYYVADDNVLLSAPADSPIEQVSSLLSAEFRERHPVVEPPPHHDTGTDIFE